MLAWSLMKWCWKAQFILSAHIFIYWHRGSPKQRLKGRGLWNDNAHSSSSRQRHALLSARNVLTNCGRPQCHSPLLLYFFFFFLPVKVAVQRVSLLALHSVFFSSFLSIFTVIVPSLVLFVFHERRSLISDLSDSSKFKNTGFKVLSFVYIII